MLSYNHINFLFFLNLIQFLAMFKMSIEPCIFTYSTVDVTVPMPKSAVNFNNVFTNQPGQTN